MPYNTSIHVCRRQKRYLDDMLNARRTITWPAHEPQKMARRIREALHAVQYHDEFSAYADLKSFYRIRARKGFVEAQWLGEDPDAPTAPSTPGLMEINEVSNIMGAIGAAIKFGHQADEIYFPNVQPSEEEKVTLWKWAGTSGWKMIDQLDKGITLTKQPVDPFLIWEPEENGA